jgi:hypothetical protein
MSASRSIPLPPCDCLDACGDDARVAKGKVAECSNYRERRLQRQRLARIDQLLQQCGHSDTLAALEELQRLKFPPSTAPQETRP